MTPEFSKWMTDYILKNKKFPETKSISYMFGIPMIKASEWEIEYSDENKKFLKGIVSDPPRKRRYTKKARPIIEPVIEKPKKTMHDVMDVLVDSGSLWFAVAIDLVLNGIGFWIIGPDPIMKVGMLCVSVIIVLFSVRAWIKRDKLLWAMFALVTSFMDTSFVLLATDVQSENLAVDTELIRLTSALSASEAYLKQLQDLQVTKEAGYANQIKDQTAVVQTARSERQSYLDKPKKESGGMSAKRVATAIPDAVMSGSWDRWIFLAVFLTVFLGLQMTIVSATGIKWSEVKNKPYSPSNEESSGSPSH